LHQTLAVLQELGVDRTPLLVYTIDRDCSAALMFSMIPMMPASVAIFESTGTPQCTERDIEKNTMWITKDASLVLHIRKLFGHME